MSFVYYHNKKIITTTNQTKERKYNDRQNKTTRDIRQRSNNL